MDITIKITHEDILFNPSIIDSVKALGQKLSGQDKPKEVSPVQKVSVSSSTDAVAEGLKKEQVQDQSAQENDVAQEESAQVESQYTVEDIRKALGDLSKAKGNAVAKGILTTFGVSKVTMLKELEYDDVMLAVKAVG